MITTDNTEVIRRLKQERDSWRRVAEYRAERRDQAMIEMHRALTENKRLRAALEHYAADYDYELGMSQWDGGAKAREALYCDEATAITPEGWQPIETAPRDGTYILLGNRDGTWVGKYMDRYVSGHRPRNPWHSMMLNCRHMGRFPSVPPTH